MYSKAYSYAWGCRCCLKTAPGNHKYWDFYTVNRVTPAPTPQPVVPTPQTYSLVNLEVTQGLQCAAGQNVDLGPSNSLGDCESRVLDNPRCNAPNEIIMYSKAYSYAWGCRCCLKTAPGAHKYWDFYTVKRLTPGIKICEHKLSNQGGGKCCTLGAGNHDINVLKSGNCPGNDKISGAKVDAGCTAEVFQHSRFRGNSYTLVGPGVFAQPADFPNDQISSIKVTCQTGPKAG